MSVTDTVASAIGGLRDRLPTRSSEPDTCPVCDDPLLEDVVEYDGQEVHRGCMRFTQRLGRWINGRDRR